PALRSTCERNPDDAQPAHLRPGFPPASSLALASLLIPAISAEASRSPPHPPGSPPSFPRDTPGTQFSPMSRGAGYFELARRHALPPRSEPAQPVPRAILILPIHPDSGTESEFERSTADNESHPRCKPVRTPYSARNLDIRISTDSYHPPFSVFL